MTKICRICSVEHKIKRKPKWDAIGICPICLEYHALFVVVRGQPNQGDKRARDLIATREYDNVLARGGE
jgi:hypothetical protein